MLKEAPRRSPHGIYHMCMAVMAVIYMDVTYVFAIGTKLDYILLPMPQVKADLARVVQPSARSTATPEPASQAPAETSGVPGPVPVKREVSPLPLLSSSKLGGAPAAAATAAGMPPLQVTCNWMHAVLRCTLIACTWIHAMPHAVF